MFGFGSGKRETNEPETVPQASEPGPPVISAILMETETFPLDELGKQLRARSITGKNAQQVNIEKGILMCNLGDEMVAVAPMPAPYPWCDLEGPCATSWMWPKDKPASTVKTHKSHVLVTMLNGRSAPMLRRLKLTQLTSLAAESTGVMGIYWPEATLVHFPKVFIEMSRKLNSIDKPPLYLWIDFRIFRNQDGSAGLFTTGLAPLGLMEIEIPRVQMPPLELRTWAENIVTYVLQKGPVLKDGNTIGIDKDHQALIRHVPSLFGKRGTVIRIGE